MPRLRSDNEKDGLFGKTWLCSYNRLYQTCGVNAEIERAFLYKILYGIVIV